jgi:hypothetical protein
MPEAVGRATYREFAPPRGLENHVACLWMQRVPSDAVVPPQLVIPNGTAEIACDLRSGPQPPTGTSGRSAPSSEAGSRSRAGNR